MMFGIMFRDRVAQAPAGNCSSKNQRGTIVGLEAGVRDQAGRDLFLGKKTNRFKSDVKGASLSPLRVRMGNELVRCGSGRRG
jgi:hypothetical protein